MRSYPVQKLSGEEVAAGPFRAETIPVSVQDDYLVVTVGGAEEG